MKHVLFSHKMQLIKERASEITSQSGIRLSKLKTHVAQSAASGTVHTSGVNKRCKQTLSSMSGLLSDSYAVVMIMFYCLWVRIVVC